VVGGCVCSGGALFGSSAGGGGRGGGVFQRAPSPPRRTPVMLSCSFSSAVRWGLLASVVVVFPARADDPVRLSERFPVGYTYQVRARVQLSGTLTVPGEKGKPAPKPLTMTGESAIDYDERVLSLDRDGRAARTVRVFRRIDFERLLGETTQKITLRPAVRRVVMLRLNNTEVPFSPDGPLTWGEIDLLRTDVFTPALVGMLPD